MRRIAGWQIHLIEEAVMTVVVGYVPTQTGFSAVTEAERQARWRDVAVVIVNIVGAAGYLVPTAADQPDLDAVVAHLSANGVRNSLRQITDDAAPADIIVGVAREVDASLIVLGLHQRSWIAKRVLGSTARSVVLAATCPVLIVPDIDQHSAAPPLQITGETPPWTPYKRNEEGPR
jgi:nucleotide-binding universal stress UspA family protein